MNVTRAFLGSTSLLALALAACASDAPANGGDEQHLTDPGAAPTPAAHLVELFDATGTAAVECRTTSSPTRKLRIAKGETGDGTGLRVTGAWQYGTNEIGEVFAGDNFLLGWGEESNYLLTVPGLAWQLFGYEGDGTKPAPEAGAKAIGRVFSDGDGSDEVVCTRKKRAGAAPAAKALRAPKVDSKRDAEALLTMIELTETKGVVCRTAGADRKEIRIVPGDGPTGLVVQGDFAYGTNEVGEVFVGDDFLVQWGEEGNYVLTVQQLPWLLFGAAEDSPPEITDPDARIVGALIGEQESTQPVSCQVLLDEAPAAEMSCALTRLASVPGGVAEDRVDVTNVTEDEVASSDGIEAFEGAYSFSVSRSGHRLQIILDEGNHVQDEVGEIACTVPVTAEPGRVFCSEPIEVDASLGTDEEENLVHAFDFTCRFDP